jgi:thioesterase domain-containing protein/acyl carrier protein
VQVWDDSRDGAGTGKRLAAYFIPQPGLAPSQAELRAFLKKRLPSYMLPAVFIEVESWPTDANAKFDARALPSPEIYFSQQGTGEAPVTELQKQLHEIWCIVIGVREAGLNDNFFDLGGHSLLAMQLIGRIESTLGLHLPLAAFFQGPTLAGVAYYFETHREAQAESALVAIRPEGTKPPIFFVHGALGTALPFYELAAQLDESRPVYAFQSLPNDTGSIEALAAAYLADLRRVQPQGPYTLCGLSMGGLVAFEMGRQLDDVHVIMLDSSRCTDNDIFSETVTLREFALALLDQPLDLPPGSDDVDAWLESVLAQGVGSKKLAEHTPLEELKRLYDVYRNNVLMTLAYRPVSYPGRFTLLRAVDSHENCALTWVDLPDLALMVHDVPGTHYTLLREPHVQVLVGVMNRFSEE